MIQVDIIKRLLIISTHFFIRTNLIRSLKLGQKLKHFKSFKNPLLSKICSLCNLPPFWSKNDFFYYFTPFLSKNVFFFYLHLLCLSKNSFFVNFTLFLLKESFLMDFYPSFLLKKILLYGLLSFFLAKKIVLYGLLSFFLVKNPSLLTFHPSLSNI